MADPIAPIVDRLGDRAAPRPRGETPVAKPLIGSVRPASPTPAIIGGWADLRDAVRASGRFDRRHVMAVALRRARIERDAFMAMGLPQPWPILLAHELRLTWQVAKIAMDGLVAERIRARLSLAERTARALELRADLFDSAIPPRPVEAEALRAQAAAVRGERGLRNDTDAGRRD